ncbi:hypothetical protein CFP65_7555 [Kitasatospora sp. MMS16-BH015]|uniref:hypothetical protein n=1 Tax=Kitasatospora sp. MMS16-BH015 TaxID=2018025 RepID=UPI000CA10AF3|nr:hypothetical protein [Kitasatospora sp. MMS16-BH015]AUG82127.1 hypothetical protein CFP65_7555 [Kitasatospora sp. MMS16-BH015]
MHVKHSKRGLGAGLATVLLLAGAAAFAGGSPAVADPNTTTAVSAGPATFTQAVPTGQPSQYNAPLERCANGVNHPISGANPVLSEPVTTQFASNVGLSEYVTFNGNQYYGNWNFVFTNTSTQTLSTDCAVLVFRAPSGSDNHGYTATQQYGHPQQDYLEVPRGDGTSFYIARVDFHDVPLAQRQVAPGQSFTYSLGGTPNSAISLTQIRDSLKFTADLTLAANDSLVAHYGTNRLTN